MVLRGFKGAWIFASLTIAGCTSATSTVLRRFENDQVVGNSNGRRCLHGEATPFKGIPITVRVPTHVDVKIYEVLFFRESEGTLKGVGLTHGRHLEVGADCCYTEKLFSVDPMKAASGTTKYSMSFGKENPQFPDKLNYDIDDTTIEDINKAIQKIVPAITGKSTAAAKKSEEESSLTTVKRMVAWKRFDLNDPCFEEALRQFVSHHLNNCDSCSGPQVASAGEVSL